MSPSTLRALAVDADLRVDVGGGDALHVRAAGPELRLEIATGRARAASGPLGGPIDAVRSLGQASPALRAAGLRVAVRLDGRTVAVAGQDARPARWSAWFGARDVELRLPALLRALPAVLFRRG